jgi:hypothetical protein
LKSYYEIVIQLEVFHDYFPKEDKNVCRSLKFIPTAECFRLLQKLRLIFKSTVNGFVLVGEKRNIGTDAAPILETIVEIVKGTRFNFFISEQDNDFIIITNTDPKLFSDGKKYVFRNNDSQAAVVNGNIATITLHNNVPITEVAKLSSGNFLGPVVISENPVKLRLLGANGEYVMEKEVPRNNLGDICTEQLLFSDTAFDEGLYRLQQIDASNSVTSEKEYFLTTVPQDIRVNGILQLEYNNIFVAQSKKEIHAVIQLQSRSIFWVYNIDIQKYEDPLEFNNRIKAADLVVDTTQSSPSVATAFTQNFIQASPLPADWYIHDKVSFRSNNPIPIHFRSYEGIQLKNTTAAHPVIINNMPNPNPLQIRESAPNTYEADIFLRVQ